MCFHIIKSVVDSQRFDNSNIYINSEDTCFEPVAKHFGIQFYKRDPNLSKDSSTNDDFLFDFISNVDCDYIYQFLATSPLVEDTTISDLSVGWSIKQLKVGSFSRSERLAKWNQCLRIGEKMKNNYLMHNNSKLNWHCL